MKVYVEGREVTVRELTVGEIRAWLADLAASTNQQQQDALGLILFEEISLREITMITDLPSMQIETLRPSSLKQLVQAIITVNPQWHDCRKRLSALGEKIRIANAANAASRSLVPV